MKTPRIPDSLRPRDASFGPGLFWAAVSLLAGVWITGNTDAIAQVAPFAGAATILLPFLYLAASIRSRRRAVRRSRSWDMEKNGNPYPAGLQPMDAAYDAVIFGRDDEIRRVVNRLRFDTALTRRFVPLEGPSGCGKSSLLRAGVLPELRSGVRRFGLPTTRAFDVIGALTPGTNPFGGLLAAVGAPDGSAEVVDGIEAIARAAVEAMLRGDVPDPPRDLLASLRSRRGSRERSVVAIDQIEELVALDPATRRGFLALLYALLHHDRAVVVVCTLRSDMSGEFLDEIGGELFRDTEKIAAMQRSQLRQVVKGPALATGVVIEDELVDRMVDEAEGADALPLLSFVLHGLYERSLKDGRISEADYDAAMGDDNAIARYADEAVAACSESLQVDAEALVIGVLLEGVAVVDGRVLRRGFEVSALSAPERSVAEFLQGARMLTLNAGRYELTHEVLLRRWPALTQAIAESHELLRARTVLDPRAWDWAQEGEPRSLLLSAAELARIGDISDRFRGLVGRFVAASVTNDVTELRRRADLAAERALLAIDPPTLAANPDGALALARAANEELEQTLSAGFALYRCWWYGLRGILRTRAGAVAAVAWSPDGKVLATVGDDTPVELWGLKAQAGSQVLSHTSRVSAVAWSPDGSFLATAGYDGSVGLWSPDGVLRHELRGHVDRVSAVAWSPDGSFLATAGYDGAVLLWSPDGGGPRSSVDHDGAVTAADWSPDGSRLATLSEDHVIRLWSPDGSLRRELAEHSKRVRALAWSPDGSRLASAGDDCLVHIYSRDGYPLSTLVGHTESVRVLAWSADSQYVASGALEEAVRLWCGESNHPHELAGHRGAVGAVAWSSDSTRLASAGVDQTVRIWSEAGEPLHELGGHSETVNAIEWSPTERALASVGVDRTVQLWSEASNRALSISGHEGTIHAVAWTPDGEVIATAGVDRSIRTWASSGELLHRLSGHSGRVQVVAWSPDGSLLASGSHDLTTRLWSRDGDDVVVLQGHTGALEALAWSPPDGDLLATGGSDGCVLIWSKVGILLARLEGHIGPVSAIAWSADGEHLATASHDQSVRIWSRDGVVVSELRGHSGPVNDVAWSPDGSRLATASHDRTIRVWSSSGSALHQLVGHTDRVHAIAWSPDGRRLASGSSDATVRIWPDPIGVPTLLDLVQEIVGLPAPTSEERTKALLPLRDPTANSL